MAQPDSSSLAEVLDRVLDKGVVVDVWARVSLVGIEILTVEARVVAASVDTFLHYAEEIAKIEQAELTATAEAAPTPEA
ncbi:gas vesicle structural protein GvpA [Halogeometricum borinquense]|uniref:Gas vesicle protein A n=2 Tax=Halogeometricum borinquense TaxID=60847 RepID=E4NUS0_HALBP|nr:gas vesicle structural protein GvpA [Halogeometricum borinquense]ADQ68790.1 Gas vesicle protein [Halogeometricum borinquense DSM 11551]ELY25647.1 gas vesicle synthesis protein GvpA [Halogeometricum borinquense DSM 11551]QIB75675.1 gas vesicle structural protein GvpA [Halogeometricum borinquense]RYJ08484.1 gas vesicle structural protein GvpA [Halogeometricum borinquense]